MKETLRRLLQALSRSIPDIPFAVQFWDGEYFALNGNEPAFTLRFGTKEAARSIFQKGTLGFAEEYMDGNIMIEGDFGEVMRLGMDPLIQYMKLSLGTRLAALTQHVKSLNTPEGHEEI